MTCFRCFIPIPTSRYGHTGTLCEACLADEMERTELERLDQQEATERMRAENDEWVEEQLSVRNQKAPATEDICNAAGKAGQSPAAESDPLSWM